jgi:hypothetical protein
MNIIFAVILLQIPKYVLIGASSYVFLVVATQWAGRRRLPLPSLLADSFVRWGLLRTNNRYSQIFDRIQKSVVIIGLDASGKSTILYRYISQCPIGGSDVFVANPQSIPGS